MAQDQADSLSQKARRYSTLKYILNIIQTAYLLILLLLFVSSGLNKVLEAGITRLIPGGILLLPVYLVIISLFYYCLNFPLNFYHSYVLEHQFALSRQGVRDWLKDQLKAGAISYIIGLILLAAFYYILAHNPRYWWLFASCFWIFFNLILARLTPVVIIPLFFKYKKLNDENLRRRIIQLAERMRVKIVDCFEIDFSKKTLKGNAAFVGLGKTRRVILADTLKDKYSVEEIEVILAHEFAHYRLRHLLKLILVNSLVTVIFFYLIFKTSGYILRIYGFTALSEIASLPVFLIYFVIFGIIMQPWENYLSRRMEKNADRMALTVTGAKAAFISMMDKLARQNLADRHPHPLIKFFFFDHPPIDERIALAQSYNK